MAEVNYDSEYSSEHSADSSSCGSSCCSESDSDGGSHPWMEYVRPDGSIFFVNSGYPMSDRFNPETVVSQNEDDKTAKSKLNPAAKLKRWMKKRRRKKRDSFPLQENYPMCSNPLSYLPSTYVYIDVDSTRQNIGRRISLSEELLGLDVGTFVEGNIPVMANKVKILSFCFEQDIPDVKPGDWLASINDEPVTIQNIDSVLQNLTLPSTVKLTIYNLHNGVLEQIENPATQCKLMEELIGDSFALEEAKASISCVNFGIFFLVIEDEAVENEGVVYMYPKEDTALFKLKGMFVTLSHMIADVASPNLLSCSVEIQGEIIHVGFAKEKNQTFLLAIPAFCCTVVEVRSFTSKIVQFLKFQYKDLENAFTVGNNYNEIDNFFTLFIKYYASEKGTEYGPKQYHLLEIIPSVQWLPLPTELKSEIGDILNELESQNYGTSSPGFCGYRRLYFNQGSCLFYKGYLLSSHLPKMDMLDIHQFLQLNHILRLSREQASSDAVIWKEVFPSRLQVSRFCPAGKEIPPSKWILLVAAMNHCVLAVLLEDKFGKKSFLQPVPFLIEEVQNTLTILQDCGIMSTTEKILRSIMPPVISSTSYLMRRKSTWKPFSVHSSNRLSATAETKMSSQNTSPSSSFIDKEPADGESSDEYSYSDTSSGSYSDSETKSESYSASSATGSQGSSESSCKLVQISDDNGSNSQDVCSKCKLSSIKNTIIQYLDMDPVQGVFLAPVDDVHFLLDNAMLKDIWLLFHQCCLQMRSVFARTLRNKEMKKSQVPTKYGVNEFLQGAYEQGALFSYNVKDSKHKHSQGHFNFWVVGRLLFDPEPHEVYLCHHESVCHDIVEFAMKLSFGVCL